MVNNAHQIDQRIFKPRLHDIYNTARKLLAEERSSLPKIEKERCIQADITNREIRTILVHSILDNLPRYDEKTGKITASEIARDAGFKYQSRLHTYEAAEKIARSLGVAIGLNINTPTRGAEGEKLFNFIRLVERKAPRILNEKKIALSETSLPAELRTARAAFYEETIAKITEARKEQEKCKSSDPKKAADLAYKIDHWKSRLVPDESELIPLQSANMTDTRLKATVGEMERKDNLLMMLDELLNFRKDDELANEDHEEIADTSETLTSTSLEGWLSDPDYSAAGENAFGFVGGQLFMPSGEEAELNIPTMISPVVIACPREDRAELSRTKKSRATSTSPIGVSTTNASGSTRSHDEYRVKDLGPLAGEKGMPTITELLPGFEIFTGTEKDPEKMYFTHNEITYQIEGQALKSLAQLQKNSASAYFQLLARYIKSLGHSTVGLPLLTTKPVDRSKSEY